jgi:hypothetical protein
MFALKYTKICIVRKSSIECLEFPKGMIIIIGFLQPFQIQTAVCFTHFDSSIADPEGERGKLMVNECVVLVVVPV